VLYKVDTFFYQSGVC